ncbi:MAG: phenylacetate-CoA oxygenase subunit PaaC [Thermaerobacter sp.]|nr:phenylacetate-CoA oxygenase subunit PaaC [Thermaerobacter sp.]
MPIGHELTGEGRAAFGEYLLLMADDELVLGHRDSEWCAFAPLIEEDVAFASIAQDEISHAALFYELIESLRGLSRDQLAFGRPDTEMRNVTLVEQENSDWAFTVVRHYLYDLADDLRTEQLLHSGEPLLRSIAERIRREERYHLEHGAMWLHRLAHGGAEARRRTQHAVDRVLLGCRGIFHPLAWEQVLVKEGLLPDRPSRLLPTFLSRAGAVLLENGLQMPQMAAVAAGPCGRVGHHGPELGRLLETMGEVWRTDPVANW